MLYKCLLLADFSLSFSSSLSFVLCFNRLFMKLFITGSIDLVQECRAILELNSPAVY